MTVTSADLSQWAAYRRAVVLMVARRVPGIDPELAASRGLELLCVELIKHGGVPDPVAFWTAASLDAALEMAHAEPPSADQASHTEAVSAPVRRALDFEVLTTAMERLPAGDQQLLWDHHVGSRTVAAIADEIGVLPYAAKRRLRRAENRLASSFAETHVGTADNVECESTRASMHDFVRNRLLPGRRQKVEDHMVQCPGCTRAFVDVRESYWMLRAAAPVLLLGAATAAKTSTAVAAAAGAGVTGVGLGGGLTTLGTRAVMTIRSALTDPVSLTATVAGGLFITTAVTTGVAGGAGALPTFPETGVVSVSTPDVARTAARGAAPASRAEDPTNLPEPTRSVTPGAGKGDGVPPGLAKQDGLPPGLTKKDDVPPGLAKEKDELPPGRSERTDDQGPPDTPGTATPGGTGTDKTPPGLAKQDKTPPGRAAQDGTPPGRAKQDGTPPGQARQDRIPPGQATKDEGSPGVSGSASSPGRSDDGSARSNPGRGNPHRG
ncbi:hypothetical protein [Promicromonospora iranensis]|uniref:Putative zinc-finger domain-containing protein n=1 Tax=Promicromonospora iranensis TaxID=1105144 RepID=A0ABU2CPG7_9MICO|nr:hypothetical protein [Promicromonospora iranensis]MDR7383218.1 hypothetical protein [Promicromonospora iranensis]